MKKYIFIGLFLIIGITVLANYQSIFESVVPPNPEIINESADTSSSRIFNYSMKVKGEVRNTGGDGYIIVKAIATQEGQEWDRTQKIYLPAYESAAFEFIFDEVKLMKDNPTYKVEAYAMGSVISN
ncbi:hypothetical protein [Christiangramia portivictoriae]|uniref:hypothetical protein n=1 Tax=Christiangramia portivictoriae TaxID=326069 RepID=UPI00047E6277|nr:hypothetical protein [Christiangramia portivictoriae]